jgi:hypothetical protein
VKRPRTIAEIARQANAGEQKVDPAIREFLDEWQGMSLSVRTAALAEEPCSVGKVQDAYLAALAEHLALSARIDVPAWTENESKFLTEPFFSGGLESLKATLLVESPLAFRRRLIFISANGLSRPNRNMSTSSEEAISS